MSESTTTTTNSDITNTPPSLILNLPTTSLPTATKFFTTLTFTFLPDWSDAQTASFRLPHPNENIALMVHTHERMKTFMRPGSRVVDAHGETESLISIMCKEKEQVDQWLERAEQAGGKKDPYVMEEYGAGMGMYTRSFADVDGHMWEVCAMLGKCCSAKEVEKSQTEGA